MHTPRGGHYGQFKYFLPFYHYSFFSPCHDLRMQPLF